MITNIIISKLGKIEDELRFKYGIVHSYIINYEIKSKFYFIGEEIKTIDNEEYGK